jgi:hypothetical protein
MHLLDTTKCNMSTRIDKNIEIPKTKSRTHASATVRQMECGDSILATTRQELTSYRNAIAYQGFKAVSRVEGKNWRVWKTKHSEAI